MADLVALVESQGVVLTAAGLNFVGLCPFHKEKAPSFTVYPKTQHYKCYGCGATGDASTFAATLAPDTKPATDEQIATLARSLDPNGDIVLAGGVTVRAMIARIEAEKARADAAIADHKKESEASWRIRVERDAYKAKAGELEGELLIANTMSVAFDKMKIASERIAELERERDGAYAERNKLVAWLARVYPSSICKTEIEGWDPEWHWCVFIDAPTGQMSWHLHDSELSLFSHVVRRDAEWDGHTTEEKYRRVDKAARGEGGER